jgi:UDP-glucuronate decarboxylase
MKLFENEKYIDDVKRIAELNLPWEKFRNNSILLSGATGLIGSFFIDVIMEKNNSQGLNCKVYALARHEERAKKRFSYCYKNKLFQFVPYDINEPLRNQEIKKAGYILHLASNTHPIAYSTDPIGTITTNIIGLKNLLDFSVEHNADRFVFSSSNEIYGENCGDVEKFNEKYCGYIDCNTLRAGYPESKRCGEALCQAYIKQRNLDIVIARLTRSYGPTLLENDTKALSQFIHRAISGKDIILKSAGNQFYSYTYVADAVSGLLTVLLCGETGEAYNVADDASDITLKNLANIVAQACGKNVIYEIPDIKEAAGYSTATKARLDSEKLKKKGWNAVYDIKTGIERTIDILKEIN